MPKTHKDLFDRFCSFENLLLASRKAAVGRFELGLERELLRLQRELLSGTYSPGRPTEFIVNEAKRRLISAAPYRGRVVHHAMCNVLEPVFDKGFIHDSYANRTGKGTHKALLRFSAFCKGAKYALKCDIVKYFESVDRRLLLGMVGRRIADPRLLALIGRVLGVDAGEKGIPIGNLTSQFLANVYLDGMDHFIKERLRCRRYLRYVDDFALLHDDKGFLHRCRAEIEAYLANLGLRLHPHKTQVFPVEQGVDFLGFKVFPTHRLLRKGNFFRFRRRLRRMAGRPFQEVKASLRSWTAHASWGDTWGLRTRLFAETAF